jgi:hypothetical protein
VDRCSQRSIGDESDAGSFVQPSDGSCSASWRRGRSEVPPTEYGETYFRRINAERAAAREAQAVAAVWAVNGALAYEDLPVICQKLVLMQHGVVEAESLWTFDAGNAIRRDVARV